MKYSITQGDLLKFRVANVFQVHTLFIFFYNIALEGHKSNDSWDKARKAATT